MDIILTLHSLVRWIIVIVAVIAIIKFAVSWAQRASVAPMDRGLMSGFTGLLDLQALLGLLFLIGLIVSGGVRTYDIEHVITMIVAVGVAHSSMRWRRETGPLALRNNLFIVIAVLVIIFIGIFWLPQGWFGNRA